MPPFHRISFDPIILELLGSDERISACLLPVFDEIKAGGGKLRRIYVKSEIYWSDACGLRLLITVSRDRTHVRISGYQIVGAIEP
jgi:hypothetical protein